MGKLKFIGDAVEGGLNAIRSAGRAAHEQQAAVRAARDAEVAEQMANLPARNKKANEALGLYHPVGGGLKLSKPTRGMHSTTVADPKFKPPKINDITPEQLVKEEAALFPLVGDRAAGGKYLTHVGENELEAPVRLTGGPLYMDANYNHLIPDDSAAWESGLGRVTALGRQAERAGEGGRPVYGIYTAGSGTNTDFNIMGANALIQQIPYSKITKKAEKEFDRAMREGSKEFAAIPNWPGIRSPEAQAMLLDKSNGIARTKLFGTMGKENFQSMGFPDVPATRKAIIEPELLDIPTNEAGFRLARMDTKGRIIEDPNIPSDYPAAMAGKVAGKLDVPADYKDVFQSHFDARRLLGQPESGDYYSFSRAHPIQYADDAWLNRLMEQRFATERKIKEGEYKKGGAVHNFDSPDASMRVKAKIAEHSGGGKVEAHWDNPHAVERFHRKQAIHKATGGLTLKTPTLRMGKGGLLGKGAKALAGAMKGAEVMPAAEREANLAKFLEPSKVPERLYHGTTATEGGKGTEAIRRIKPSKEGALGSGVYMTPSTPHASSYTGIPNDEALEAMRLGGDYSKKMADQFAADRITGRLREGQVGGNMLPVHAQIRNPLIIGKSGRNIDPAADALMSLGMDEASAVKLVEKAFEEKGNIGKQIQSRAQAQGYDGIMQYRGDNLSEVVSYNPNAVKSAIGNQGTYDINHPDLSKAKGGVILKHTTLRNRGATQAQPNGFKEGGKSEATVQATPRKKGYGMASDVLKEVHEFASKPFGYDNPPVEFISELLGIPAASRVLDKLSYGEPITNYGKANVPLIPDDTFDAFTAGLGGLGAMSKLAKPLAKGVKVLSKEAPATRHEAMKLAQERAALPKDKGGLGLSKDNTAEQRAKAMGYDKDVYHGTRKDFAKFKGDQPIFATEDPKIAAKYGDITLPLKLRGKELTVSDLSDDKSGRFAENLAKELGVYDETDPFRHSDVRERELINMLSDKDIDRLRVTDMSDMGGVQTQYMLPAGSDNVRSRFAAFDPFRRTAATAAAMGVAAPDLLAEEIKKRAGGAILKHTTLRNRRANQRVR